MKIEFVKSYFIIPVIMLITGIYIYYNFQRVVNETVVDEETGEEYIETYVIPPTTYDYLWPVLGSGILGFILIYTTERMGCFRINSGLNTEKEGSVIDYESQVIYPQKSRLKKRPRVFKHDYDQTPY